MEGERANRNTPIALRLKSIIKALRNESFSQEFGTMASVLGALRGSSSYSKYSKMGKMRCQLFSLVTPWRHCQNIAGSIPHELHLEPLRASMIFSKNAFPKKRLKDVVNYVVNLLVLE